MGGVACGLELSLLQEIHVEGERGEVEVVRSHDLVADEKAAVATIQLETVETHS